ncbi:hypothetical protein [Amycolatopsis pittospori]|uniref:hypothetical protein n=1 Tax=Amycolatopsis pittospori TaxID=2749434 RepID=UPI001F420C5D|nr:hypothetical protein [Amycolatopsis pittospori]
MEKQHPEVTFDREASLSGPASAHEQAGYDLLLSQGIDAKWARFARTLDRLIVASGQSPWEIFMALDDVLDRIAAEPTGGSPFKRATPSTVDQDTRGSGAGR